MAQTHAGPGGGPAPGPLPRLTSPARRPRPTASRSGTSWRDAPPDTPTNSLINRGLGVSALPAATTAIAGSWVYPLLTVHLPHRHYGDDPLDQTRTLRGRVIPAVFLELTYHLEHHLYPQVPSHHLARLSRRLDPFLTRSGVVPRRVI